MKQFRSIIIVAFSILSFVITIAAVIPAKPVTSKFKNLRILPKNISEAALDKIMDDFNYSLGVKCNYCHTKNEKTDDLIFEKDTKPEKNIARKMMLMTYDINIKYFNASKDRLVLQTVSCITCHRQQPYPTTQLDSAITKNK
jgi:hypothetical protein